MLGLFTQLGCLGAMAFLALFYLSQPPLTGLPMTGAEGENLIVNKNLIELIAVIAVFSFRTGWMAGLDQLRLQRRRSAQAETAVGIPGVSGQRP
jgi:thiosulfate dehydrogenase [quinone] large subunit